MRKSIKIIAKNIPDDIVTYMEYTGKPYYEINEENGEVIVGCGTCKIILSEWLNKYFLDNKIDKVLEIMDSSIRDIDALKVGRGGVVSAERKEAMMLEATAIRTIVAALKDGE